MHRLLSRNGRIDLLQVKSWSHLLYAVCTLQRRRAIRCSKFKVETKSLLSFELTESSFLSHEFLMWCVPYIPHFSLDVKWKIASYHNVCTVMFLPAFSNVQKVPAQKSLNECKILHSNLKNTSLQIAIHCNFMLFFAASSVHKNAVTRNFSGDWSKNWITHSSVILSLKREIDGDRRSRRREEERSEPANCVTSFPRDA